MAIALFFLFSLSCPYINSSKVFLTNKPPNVSSPLESNAVTAPSPSHHGLPTPTMLPMLSTPPMSSSLLMSLTPPMLLTPPTPLGWHPLAALRSRFSLDPPSQHLIFMDSHQKNFVRVDLSIMRFSLKYLFFH